MKRLIMTLFAGAVVAASLTAAAAPGNAFWAKIADFGAIAYDVRTGGYGIANKHANKASAQRAARRDCRRRGFNCRRVFWVRNACLYIYKDKRSTRFGWAWHRNQGTARRNARRNCERGGRDCGFRAGVCTRR